MWGWGVLTLGEHTEDGTKVSSSRSGMGFTLVARVGNSFQKCFQFHGSLNCALAVHVRAGMRIVLPLPHDSSANGLSQGVSIRATGLRGASDVTVEIVAGTMAAPERYVADLGFLHHKPGDRAVELAHHFAKLISDAEIAERVVMVVEDRGDPGDVAVQGCVIGEPIPEDGLGVFSLKSRKAITYFGGDECRRRCRSTNARSGGDP